jgi:hypothetical protein
VVAGKEIMPAAWFHLHSMTDSASTASRFFFFFLKKRKRIRNKRERYPISVLLGWGVSWVDILKETGLRQPGG